MKQLQPIIYATLIAFGIYIGKDNDSSKVFTESKINNIIEIINTHYVDSINHAIFENDAINSILSELDPHSSYISKNDFKTVEEDMKGSFSGIGIEFNIIQDSIVVVSAISGGPSEKIGIESGDRIVLVEKDNVASVGIKNEDVIQRLRGKKGSPVSISIKRKGVKKIIPFKIIRDEIPLHSIDAGIMLNNDIAYIKINRFAATTYSEMMEKITILSKKGMKNLILDFRDNPGGYLHIASQICDEFLSAGELIVFTEGRKRNKKETFATKKGSLKNIKVIALINEGSASASEIVSGALQDNDRGLIIGRKSFGKGLVQEQIALDDGSAIRLTTQRYFTPSGRCIQKNYNQEEKDYSLEKHTQNNTSAEFPENLKFKTKNGREVYGGGGITPDIIIKRDSSINYLQINTLIRKGWINQFCFIKSQSLKEQNIKNYKQIDMKKIYLEFTEYIKTKDIMISLKLGNTEFNYLETLLLATISRNIWGNNTYYKILSENDKYIQTAIKNF